MDAVALSWKIQRPVTSGEFEASLSPRSLRRRARVFGVAVETGAGSAGPHPEISPICKARARIGEISDWRRPGRFSTGELLDVPNIRMSRDADVPTITAIYAHHNVGLRLRLIRPTQLNRTRMRRHVPSRRLRPARYPERTNFWKHRGVNGASRAAAPDATVTSPT